MERDPVCGMQVDPEKARARADHAGRTYYFCCTGCAQKFQAAPGKYLAPRPALFGPIVNGDCSGGFAEACGSARPAVRARVACTTH